MTYHSFLLVIMICTTFLVSRNVGSPGYISRSKWPDDLEQIDESDSLTHKRFYPIDHYEPLTNNIIDMRSCDSAFAPDTLDLRLRFDPKILPSRVTNNKPIKDDTNLKAEDDLLQLHLSFFYEPHQSGKPLVVISNPCSTPFTYSLHHEGAGMAVKEQTILGKRQHQIKLPSVKGTVAWYVHEPKPVQHIEEDYGSDFE